LADYRFRAFLHSIQLVLPVALEGSGPLVKRAYRFGIGPVQLLAALAAHPNQTHVAQHAQVLGDGRLPQAEDRHNISDGPLGSG
jgi:23S rRNA G2445 N2-methylase RlmL